MTCTHQCNQGRNCTCTVRPDDADQYDTWEAIFKRLAVGIALLAIGGSVCMILFAVAISAI